MTTSRTAISLNSDLLKQTDKIAKETGNSRSGVVAIALQKYFRELEQQKISAALDEVYGDESNSDLDVIDAGSNYFANNILDREEW